MTKIEEQKNTSAIDRQYSLSLRDILQVGFRRKRALLLCFFTLMAATIVYCFVLPPKYESETKILVQRERLDPMLSTERQEPMIVRNEVTEEELNSEVEIILSDDVLGKVVDTLSLQNVKNPGIPNPFTWLISLFQSDDPKVKRGKAIDDLQKRLDVQPVKKSNIITITYRRRDQGLVTRVLTALDRVYVEKHLQVRRPSGQFEFFEEKTNNYRKQLADAENELLKFSNAPGAVKPDLARDIALQKLSDFNASLHDTRAQIADTQDRIHMLEREQSEVPARLTTSSRRLDNPDLMKELKATLLNLELKHTELLEKFQPDYRPVQEVEAEIRKTKAAIDVENGVPLRDESTDSNPTYQWVQTEMAKAKADLKGLTARAAATEQNIREYQAITHDLENKQITAADLTRDVKAAEENYLLYLRKREEARINDALDKSHMLNVAIAEPPTAPSLPVHSPFLLAAIGTFLSVTVSVGLVFTLDYMDSSFHTPREIEQALQLPVLATVAFAPEIKGERNSDGHGNSNGNGNGNGRRPLVTHWWKKKVAPQPIKL